MKKIFALMTALGAFLIMLLTLKELLGKDKHVQALVAWFASTGPWTDGIGSASIAWTGFISGLTSKDSAAWYTWIILSLAGSSVLFVARVIKEFRDWGTNIALPDVFIWTAAATGSFLVLLGVKLTWLCFGFGAFWSIAVGVVSVPVLIVISRFLYGLWTDW